MYRSTRLRHLLSQFQRTHRFCFISTRCSTCGVPFVQLLLVFASGRTSARRPTCPPCRAVARFVQEQGHA